MKLSILWQLVASINLASAVQPSAPNPVAAPLRDIKFGGINFLHTTDTHGWHAGHLREASYSADWGDYVDFASHLRQQIEADGKDLLVIDTGDRIEGNGLCDASTPKGKYTLEIFQEQHVDIICSGNHELYQKASAEHERDILVPAYHDAYLASNLDIYDPATGEFVALAPRYRTFTTKKQGIRILAFGFLFNFNRNYNNTRVQLVEEAVQEEWFQQAIRIDEVDLVVVIAHSAARSSELDTIFKTIRTVKPETPIQFFAGHFHIRDYKKFDDKAYALASGRFMETIGFQSIDGIVGRGKIQTDSAEVKADAPAPTWFRRYIDNNLHSYYRHSKTNATTFHSTHGRAVSARITAARQTLNLDEIYGCAPRDLWMSRSPFPAPDSIYSWMNESVLPQGIVREDRKHKDRLIMTNSGSIRFDILKGPFTRDSTFIVSPFVNLILYIRDVPLAKALMVTPILNQAGVVFSSKDNGLDLDVSLLASPEQRARRSDNAINSIPLPLPSSSSSRSPSVWSHDENGYRPEQRIFLSDLATAADAGADQGLHVTPGYTTIDDFGTDGDDTIHSPISYYNVPNIIQSRVTGDSDPQSSEDGGDSGVSAPVIDLVFNGFLQPYILAVLAVIGETYTTSDVEYYLNPNETMGDAMVGWIKTHWDTDC